MSPSTFWGEICLFLRNLLIAVGNGNCGPRDCLICVESRDQTSITPCETSHARQVRTRDSADLADRHPVFAKLQRLPRLEECVSFLIAKQSALDFDVCAVVIGKCLAPIHPICVDTPGPDFLGGEARVVREMHGPRIGLWMPHSHEVFAAAMDKLRNRSAGVIANDTEIETIIDRPGSDFGEAVRRCKPHGINDLRVVPHSDAGVVPPVETMPHVAAVIQRDPLLEHGRFWSKNQLDGPLHAVNAIDIADGDRGAAVVMPGIGVIDWRHRDPIVRNRKIEFDAECRPGSAITNRRLLDR